MSKEEEPQPSPSRGDDGAHNTGGSLLQESPKRDDHDMASTLGPHVDAIGSLDTFIRLAWAGMGYSSVATRVVEIVEGIRRDKYPTEDIRTTVLASRLDEARRLEAFASEENDNGFPYLYSLASIRLWTILEAAIDDMVLQELQREPERRKSEVVGKLRGPLMEFVALTPVEQADYLLDLLKREVGTRLRYGVGAFESLLEAVGLGGGVHDSIRRILLELGQVRNVLVHRNGRADARLISSCPWLNLRLGDTVRVRPDDFHNRYVGAAYWYLLELDSRLDRVATTDSIDQPTSEYVRQRLELKNEIVLGIEQQGR